ncbi:MAG: bifunctional folylpolyglutamate synthase/dihydrofolate synthase [Blastocatellia bacterium]|nr:bifunctional folylpolyglutamate synthase/dihydrofolate synthase [Blastocatellia bacterium]
MNFEEAVGYLYSLGHETLAMKLGLETISVLAAACGQPQHKFPAIHLAGTNGKGSTAAMTDAILRAAGYRSGLYTSPHLVAITERIRVNGVEISPDDFARLATAVRAACERLVAEGALEAPATYFEQVTMIAFLYFAEREVDAAVLEVGMGGRFDATNICRPIVTAIMPIGYDHQEHLGNTLAQIAGEKAGIIKAGVPVVVAPQEKEAMQAIANRAAELHARIVPVEESLSCANIEIGGEGRYRLQLRTPCAEFDALLSLPGRHQVENALTAIIIAEQLVKGGWKISSRAVNEGLSNTRWPGRLEIIQVSHATFLLDGAHNAAGARVLRDYLTEHCSSRPLTLIFAVMADKAIDEMAELLFPLAQNIIVTKVRSPRAADPLKLREVAAKWNENVNYAEDADQAIAAALKLTPPNGVTCACGSLFLVGEIRENLRRRFAGV